MTSDILFKRLEIRSEVIRAIRKFFHLNHFLEVETPVRCPAVIPEAHIQPVTSGSHFLQASPELCMKRLLSRGADRIFQICRCFRDSERGRLHLPEMTLLEWYAVDHTYLELMNQCEALIRAVSAGLNQGDAITRQGRSIRLDQPWQRLTVENAFRRHSRLSLKEALVSNRFDEILSFEIEPALGWTTPTFLHDYPASLATLAKGLPDKPAFSQRVELYMAGIELANGFTELTDAKEQRTRFHQENLIRISRNEAPLPLPEKFLADLEIMPEAAGMALGVDRLIMLLCDAKSIDEVVAFTPEDL